MRLRVVRNVDLIGHLPEFMREYEEIKRITDTENPEFQFVVDSCESVRNNIFIESCNESGIERFEKLLGIIPTSSESLDARRSRVMMRWNDVTPYTLKVLIDRLTAVYGADNFKVSLDTDKYFLNLLIYPDMLEQMGILEDILSDMIPANIVLKIQARIQRDIITAAKIGGIVTTCRRYTINSERVTL